MSVNEALAVVKAAGYRVTAPRVRNPVRVPRLNAVGKPYSPSFDPSYRMKYRAGSTAHLFKPYGKDMKFVRDQVSS